jgi:hypothetical protein
MSIELDNVMGKIRKLANMTVEKGCTEEEALSAATRIGELLQTYNLSIDKVFLDKQDCITGFCELEGRQRRHPISGCTVAIGEFCDCKVWASGGGKFSPSRYNFFGLETDVEMAKYLFNLILQAMDNATADFKKSDQYKNPQYGTHRKTLTVSFQHGFANRLRGRLKKMAAERHEQEKKQTIVVGVLGTTDIVLIKSDKVESEYEKLGLRLRTVSRSYGGDWGARGAGAEAGSKVNLNRPMGGASATKGLLA